MGHVPRRISAACALFLQHHGSIRCEITGDRRYSSDLLQETLIVVGIVPQNKARLDVEQR